LVAHNSNTLFCKKANKQAVLAPVSPPLSSPSSTFAMGVLLALLYKCILRRCKSPSGSAIPFGFLLEVFVPLGFFYLFSWVSTEIDDESVLPGVPGDVYSMDSDSAEGVFASATFVDYVNRGYDKNNAPTCIPYDPDNCQGRGCAEDTREWDVEK
jgi:hypothetical protein